jgi:hypothetical protein
MPLWSRIIDRCNFLQIHETLHLTPAMTAGERDAVMMWEQIIEAMHADALKPGPRGPYKMKAA